MEIQYQVVPNIISGKDLDYLTDMFQWTYTSYKRAKEVSHKVEDIELVNLLEKISNALRDHMGRVLSLLQEGGENEFE